MIHVPALGKIIHETENHFVMRTDLGFDVFKKGITCGIRVARIGEYEDGLERAKREIERRESKDPDIGVSQESSM